MTSQGMTNWVNILTKSDYVYNGPKMSSVATLFGCALRRIAIVLLTDQPLYCTVLFGFIFFSNGRSFDHSVSDEPLVYRLQEAVLHYGEVRKTATMTLQQNRRSSYTRSSIRRRLSGESIC